MKQELELVHKFHRQIDSLVNASPTVPDETVRDFRITLLNEEMDELIESMKSNSLEATAKELADLLYVTYGTILSYGLQDVMEEIFCTVHKSNMSKTSREMTLCCDSKALKDDDYTSADVASILDKS